MCKPSFNLFEVAGGGNLFEVAGGGNSDLVWVIQIFLKKFLLNNRLIIKILVLIFSRKLGKKNVNFFPR